MGSLSALDVCDQSVISAARAFRSTAPSGVPTKAPKGLSKGPSLGKRDACEAGLHVELSRKEKHPTKGRVCGIEVERA